MRLHSCIKRCLYIFLECVCRHRQYGNTCFFRISLVIKDEPDTANGEEGNAGEETVLWTSDFIEPGEHVKSIKLSKELESGEYTATLKYECFRLQDKTPLNGSNVELTLNVN